jgi:hypothetical protein
LKDGGRGCDTLARYGGDEFVMLLEELADRDQAALIGERILTALQVPLRTLAGEIIVSASIGIHVATNCDDYDSLLRAADRAMYEGEAKRPRRHPVFATRPDLTDHHSGSSASMTKQPRLRDGHADRRAVTDHVERQRRHPRNADGSRTEWVRDPAACFTSARSWGLRRGRGCWSRLVRTREPEPGGDQERQPDHEAEAGQTEQGLRVAGGDGRSG